MFNKSLQERLKTLEEILLPHIEYKTVLELGCGSAFLMEKFVASKVRKYVGVDFADTAIKHAQQRAVQAKIENKVSLFCDNAIDVNIDSPDVVYSAGLLDWLEDNEIETIFKRYPKALHIHSFSKKEFSIKQLCHRAYVFCSYGHSNDKYTPRYFQATGLQQMFSAATNQQSTLISSKAMGFSTFISSVPTKCHT